MPNITTNHAYSLPILIKVSIFPSRSGLPQLFHGVRNLVASLRVFLFFSRCRKAKAGKGAGALQNGSTDTVRGALFALTPPQPFDIHNSNAGEKWKEFEQAWKNYSIAMKLHQKPKAVQVATLLT